MKTKQGLVFLIALQQVAAVEPAGTREIRAPDMEPAAHAVNALGLDLLARGSQPEANALLSPYSIQSALAMTWAGAAGDTHAEMARVLHYAAAEAELHGAMEALRLTLDAMTANTVKLAEAARKRGGPSEPITLTIANRLFGQQGYEFRAPFLALAKDRYRAPLQTLDFVGAVAAARREINGWVEGETRRRIRDLIPPDGLDRDTRLVLVNAIHLKAPWHREFAISATKPQPFHVRGGPAADVPTMVRQDRMGFARRDGFSAVTIPYSGGDLQLLVLLPDEVDGLAAMEAKLTPEALEAAANPTPVDVILHLPKFKLRPPLFRLSHTLKALGLRSAFDDPRGSANFDRMAPRKPDEYLFISEVFHQTFLELDERGTEAAAATAVVMARATSVAVEPREPVEVRVDRPFLFAIQHRPSGACLFLGRMTDPR